MAGSAFGGLSFKATYDSYEDNTIHEFLIPALGQSQRYDRAVGFFSSAVLTVLAEAFSTFAERGGKMRLVCSPVLTPSDADLFVNLTSESLISDLNHSLNTLEQDGLIVEPLDLMASLIKMGCLSIKFAIPYDPTRGMFHPKLGLFIDEDGNRVGFLGSNNESLSGWLDLRNAETFSVYQSWRDQNDLERVEDIERRFNRFWTDSYDGFDILDFAESLDFIERRQESDVSLEEAKAKVRDWYSDHSVQSTANGLYGYQQQVIRDWIDNGYRGLVCFATGAGKTRTAIEAINLWRQQSEKHVVIIIVPSRRLQKQWLQELRRNLVDRSLSILTVGGDTQPDKWRSAITDVTDFRRHQDDGLVLAIDESAAKEAFFERVSWGQHILVVADEVHNLGAPSFHDLLNSMRAGAILGLSATPERYNDDETLLVRNTFGRDLLPIVDIPYAQDLGVLVPYRYRFETVSLDDDELIDYRRLSQAIGRRSSQEGVESEEIQVLRARRSNILKNANSKIPAAAALLFREFKHGDSWLVFCNDTEQLEQLRELIQPLRPLDYHGRSQGDPDATLRLFESQGGILLSIHMMDEGVDIPSIDHCLLIASSQSKRQFIQRRGRVLRADRRNPKGSAEIWDLIVVGEDGKAFIEAEVERAMEFGSMALNRSIVGDLSHLKPQAGTI